MQSILAFVTPARMTSAMQSDSCALVERVRRIFDPEKECSRLFPYDFTDFVISTRARKYRPLSSYGNGSLVAVATRWNARQ